MSKRSIREMTRDETVKRRKQGRKVVSHGTYRAARKPNSPRVRNAK